MGEGRGRGEEVGCYAATARATGRSGQGTDRVPQFVGNDSRVAKIVIKRLDGRLTRRGKDGKRVPVKLKLGTVRRQISPTK